MTDEKKITEHPKEDEAKKGKSRREVMQKMLVGGGVVAGAGFLPEKWVKPIVEFIEVPAHAQTSTLAPSAAPTLAPTSSPTAAPTTGPTAAPTTGPTASPVPTGGG